MLCKTCVPRLILSACMGQTSKLKQLALALILRLEFQVWSESGVHRLSSPHALQHEASCRCIL